MKTTFLEGSRSGRWLAVLLVLVSPLSTRMLPGQMPTGKTDDPRVGLKAGMYDAGEVSKNLKLVSHQQKPDSLMPGINNGLAYINSDLAFASHYVYQGNFNGFEIWDVTNPAAPVIAKAVVCVTGQGDPSIWGNLLFISSESVGNRIDCGPQGVPNGASPDRMRGVRIYDVSDPKNPQHLTDVQTCRGSHTHTLVPDPKDKSVVYIYISGTAGVRDQGELAGCVDTGIDDPNSATFRVEVIRVPLAHPEQWSMVGSARIFEALTRVPGHGNPPGDTLGRGARGGGGGGGGGGANAAAASNDSVLRSLGVITLTRTSTKADSDRHNKSLDSLRATFGLPPVGASAAPGRGAGGGRGGGGINQCHDITVYPAIGLAGGACAGLGLLLDIKDPVHPKRLQAVGDSNFAFWHSATFSNDGSKLLFSDEWGGGTQAKCRAIDPLDWGGDAIFNLKDGHLTPASYYKMPAAQTEQENCVAHNGALIPVPGRDIMSQGFYQGGVTVFDFTDIKHPVEIAYFDRGPISPTRLVTGGYWCAYYYNGFIYASELARGLDVFELQPSDMLSQNEIDAAKLIKMDQFNPQSQPKLVWPAAFPVVRSYLDQLVRNKGLPVVRTTAIGASLTKAEQATGAARRTTLTTLAAALDKDARTKDVDAPRIKAMAAAVRDLAKATK